MLENFGLYEQENMKKSLSAGLDDQWDKAFTKAGSAMKKARTAVGAIKAIESTADGAAKAMKEGKRKSTARSKLGSSLY